MNCERLKVNVRLFTQIRVTVKDAQIFTGIAVSSSCKDEGLRKIKTKTALILTGRKRQLKLL